MPSPLLVARTTMPVAARHSRCPLCNETIRPDEDLVVIPDFLADENDPFWRCSDAAMHRACFVVWEQRKTFIARFNQVARRYRSEDGTYQHMTAEGDIVLRTGGAPGGPTV